jgi:hypothetical protein
MLLYKWVDILMYYYQLFFFLQFINTATVAAVKPHAAAMYHPRTTLGSLHPEESQVPSSYPPELARGFSSLKNPAIGTSNYLTGVLSNGGNHSISQYGMKMTYAVVDLPMTPEHYGGVRANHGLMEKANFSLAEYERMKKQDQFECMLCRRLDREVCIAERYDQCDSKRPLAMISTSIIS